MSRTRYIGLFAGTYNFPFEDFKTLSKFNFKIQFIRDIKDTLTRLKDLLLFSSPHFDEDQLTAFMEYIDDGGTAVVLISADNDEYQASINLLAALGIEAKSIGKSKNLPIEYTEDYPQSYKRGTKNKQESDQMSNFVNMVPLEKTVNKKVIPLIITKGDNGFSSIAIKILYGQGAVIVINAFSLSNDLIDMFDHLFDIGGAIRENQLLSLRNELKAQLVYIIEESFEIYEEIPLPVIRRKVEPNNLVLEMDDIDFLLVVEELIREGTVYAKIRGGTLIRY